MEGEIGSPASEEFVAMKAKMYSFLVDNNSEYKKHRVRIKMFLKK